MNRGGPEPGRRHHSMTRRAFSQPADVQMTVPEMARGRVTQAESRSNLSGVKRDSAAVPLVDVGKASWTYLPALDGFRAISILLVVFSHTGLESVIPGGLGVIIFFVISGFLIMRQMIAEIGATGDVSFKGFYLRRFFRLAPALLLYLAIFDVVFVALGAHTTWIQVVSGILYFANFYHIFVGYPPHNANPILWSLSIEEHFYAVAPLVIFAFRRNLRHLLAALCLLLVLVLVWRTILYQHCLSAGAGGICGVPGGLRIFHGTDTMFDCIAYGCVMALVLHFHGATVARLARHTILPWAAVGVLFATLLLRDPFFRDTLRYSLQAGSAAVIMSAVLYGRWPLLRRFLCLPLSLLIGKLSYSLYLFHFGVGTLLVLLFPGRSLLDPPYLALFLAGSFGMASLSYFLVEKPMVAVRRRLGSVRPIRQATDPAQSIS